MPLSLNEIRDSATAFVRDWREDRGLERQEAQTFWNEFFHVFGVNRRRVAAFEKPVVDLLTRSHRGRVDLLWKGVVLVEHKSRGEDLESAMAQARDYFPGLRDSELPRFVIASDFARIRLHDLEAGTDITFRLEELPRRIGSFGFLSGYQTQHLRPLAPVDVEASEKLGALHDLLEADGFGRTNGGRDLDVWLVRTLFCLFADSAGIWEPGLFRDLVERRTAEDGNDLGAWLGRLHRVLAQPVPDRQRALDENLAAFPWVNGHLFDAPIEEPATSRAMREALLDACRTDWSRVSPAIFGSLFQSIKDRAARRAGGEHYTTEQNILKCLDPLFLDGLRADLAAAGRDHRRLDAFLVRLRRVRVLDPACGCGNFLVVAYRELRGLELAALRARWGDDADGHALALVQSIVNVDQMFGLEIGDWPAQIATVALWLTDHQMNMALSAEFGALRIRLPLRTAPNIRVANALHEDWAAFLAPGADTYCVGNPPFIGHQYRSAAQQADMRRIWGDGGRFRRLDYVTCWYPKAVDWMQGDPRATACFVSTNSISQGEQVGTLWGYLLPRGARIRFAHRTFQWTSEASGRAAVHCVIVGFGLADPGRAVLFDYATPRSVPQRMEVSRINPYLAEGPDVLLESRNDPPAGFPQLKKGSQPTDGGHLILTERERAELLEAEPAAEPWLRRYMGGDELINGGTRWCLWLKDIQPGDLRRLRHVSERVALVRDARSESPTDSVRDFAGYPTLFTQDRQPATAYLALPEVSSESRRFIPMAFLGPEIIASNKIQMLVGATPFHFAILNSTMHMAWVRAVSGRLESRYSYAPAVYNNFPWPTPTTAQRAAIEASAQAILDVRAEHPLATLADLYDPLAMPPGLVRAHAANDRAVDAAYGQPRGFATEAARLAFLFERHAALAAPLDATRAARPARRPRRRAPA